MEVKVVSFNIRCANDPDGHSIAERAPRLLNILSDVNADFIGYQEAIPEWEEFFKNTLCDKYEMFLVYRAKSNLEAVPMMWKKDRFECLDKGHFWLSDTPEVESRGWDERFNCFRICLWAKLRDKASGKTFLFMNTHFGFGDNGQSKSARLIAERCKQYGENLPVFVTGDYNMTPTDVAYSVMTEHFTDANAVVGKDWGNTFHGYTTDKNLDTHIDYCFINDKVTPLSYTVLNQTFDGKYPSDHYGLLFEFEI